MKFVNLVVLPAVVSAAILDTRQAKPAGGSPGFVDITPSKNAPRIHADAKRTETRFGRKFTFLPRATSAHLTNEKHTS